MKLVASLQMRRQNNAKTMRQGGIEPPSNAWKASMLAITPLTQADTKSKEQFTCAYPDADENSLASIDKNCDQHFDFLIKGKLIDATNAGEHGVEGSVCLSFDIDEDSIAGVDKSFRSRRKSKP